MTMSADTKAAGIVHAFRMLQRSAATALFLSAVLCGQAQVTSSVQVATMAPNNRTVAVYYRVPKEYDAKRVDAFGWGRVSARGGRSADHAIRKIAMLYKEQVIS